MTPRVINIALQSLTTAIGLSSTWKPLKAHIGSLLNSVVFPLCCFNDEDEELWHDDPQEYIRKVGSTLQGHDTSKHMMIVVLIYWALLLTALTQNTTSS